jgi:uncharacterized protein (TIGR00255 family)
MIRSMTGFGAAMAEITGHRVRLEIKTLNNRHREFIFRLPHFFGRLEEPIKKIISKKVFRGRIEVAMQTESAKGREAMESISIDIGAAKILLFELNRLSFESGLGEKVALSHLLGFEKYFMSQEGGALELTDPELLAESMSSLAEKALEQLIGMRETEGASLEEDIRNRIEKLKDSLVSLRTIAANVPAIVTKRYQARLEELAETLIDPDRLAQEAAILAEKLDITEEITRFTAHVKSLTELLDSKEPAGRRMEFLLQELVREANTMGSKSQSLSITEIVLSFKSELEKIREQVLNIE